MRSLTRLVMLGTLAVVLVPLWALPVLAKEPPAKQESEVGSVVLFGPDMRVKAAFQGQAAQDFARDTGMLDAANAYSTVAVTTPPAASTLGPRYTVSYAFGWAPDRRTVSQYLYPYAAGGAVAFTAAGQGLHANGWWRVSPNLVPQLRAAGLPSLPGTPTAGAVSSSLSTSDSRLGLWIAFVVVGLIGLADALLTRRARGPARQAAA